MSAVHAACKRCAPKQAKASSCVATNQCKSFSQRHCHRRIDTLSTAFETVIFEKHNAVARVTLNRPRVLNVYNLKMRDELFEIFSTIAIDDEVQVLVLSGAGRA